MIYLYSGTPGSGKSLHQAEEIYYILRAGKPVLANFEVNTSIVKTSHLGEFYYISNEILSPELLIKYSQIYFRDHKFKEGQIRLFIDEAQLLFNAREWSKAGRKEWLSFFTQHRKYGYDIYLVAQFDRMIDRQIRSLIEYEVIHRKVKNFGRWGTFFNLVAGGNLFVAVTMWYPMHERLSSTWYKGNKKYFELYNTYNTFNTEGDTENASDNTRLNQPDTSLSLSHEVGLESTARGGLAIT